MRRPTRAAHSRPATRRHSRRGQPRRALTLSLLAALLCHLAPLLAPAQAPAAKGATPANGSVSGRVTTSDGKPAANTVVALSPGDFDGMRGAAVGSATTGDDGRYKIAGVAAGHYRVQALAPLYAAPDDQGRGPFDSGKTVTVGAGESVENIDFTLVRGGVVTGRVTGQEGRPVVAEHIYLMRADQPTQGGFGGTFLNTLDFDTDDRGVYRIYGVPPGRYLVSVGIPRDGTTIRIGGSPVQYQRTFYPGTTDASQAKPVEITAGGETTGVDIALAEAPKSYEARGRIVDEEGKPVARIGFGYGPVRPNQPQLGAWGMDGSRTNDAGEFVVRNLTPGRYAVFASSTDYGMTPIDVYSDAVQFEVTDENVEGLVVKVHGGASVSGAVVMEGVTDRAILAKLAQLYVSAHQQTDRGAPPPADQLAAPSFSQGRVQPDGTFRLSGLRPGKYVFTVFSGQSRGFTMIGVQRAGADATGGIDVGEGEQVTGVRVRVGYGAAVIRGQIVLRATGDPVPFPPGTRFNVVARRAGSTVPMLPGGEVDSRGHFVMEGLLGGDYDLNVFMYAPPQPGVAVSRPISAHQHVSVPDGGEANVTVTLDINQQTERNP